MNIYSVYNISFIVLRVEKKVKWCIYIIIFIFITPYSNAILSMRIILGCAIIYCPEKNYSNIIIRSFIHNYTKSPVFLMALCNYYLRLTCVSIIPSGINPLPSFFFHSTILSLLSLFPHFWFAPLNRNIGI